MKVKSVDMVFDLNQPPLPSPREAVIEDDDDEVRVIDPPPAFPLRKKREAAGTLDKYSDVVSVVCSSCKDVSKVRFLGTEEERRVWKCFKCLLKYGGAERAGSGSGAGVGLGLLDINASPPSEGEADGASAGPDDDVCRRGGDGNLSGKVKMTCFSSSPRRLVGLSSTLLNMSLPESRFHLQKAPRISIDIGRSGLDGIVDYTQLIDVSLNKIDKSSAALGAVQDKHHTSTEPYLKAPKEVYLQGLRDYINEINGALTDGWQVEFKFCNKRIKTFAVYIAPDGSRFESMPEVAYHLGLPSSVPPFHSDSVQNGLRSPQNGAHLNQKKKESLGVTAANSRQKLSIPKSSNSLRVHSSDAEGTSIFQDDFPVQFEDFYLLSVGAIDFRPAYHNNNQIWPVGYRSMWHDKITGSIFVFNIADGGDSGPNFKLQRYPCTEQTIPISSTVLSRHKLVSLNKVASSRITDDDDNISLEIMLTENNAPCLDDIVLLNRDVVLNRTKVNLGSCALLSQFSGESSSNILEHSNSIGEIVVEGKLISTVWEKICKAFMDALHESYTRKGAIQFGCEHDHENHGKEPEHLDLLSKFSRSAAPIDISHAIDSDNNFESACEQVQKWLQVDRSGLDTEFVQEIIEQLPGVAACSQYTPLVKRNECTTLQTFRSGFFNAKRMRDNLDSDNYFRSPGKPKENSQHSEIRGPFPLGKPIHSKLPESLIGDALQVWDFSCRFFEVLELPKPFSFQELEEELINPWPDECSSGDVSYRSSKGYSEAMFSSSSYRLCTGIVLSKVHISLLKVLVGELLSRVAMHVDPNFDAGESKSRRGRKKDSECSAMVKKMQLEMMPINEVTWPEIARRYILAVLSMEGNLDSAEIVFRESGRVFHCLRGDGGILCGSLTGVALLEADALILSDAAKKIFGSKDEVKSTARDNYSAGGATARSSEITNGEVPEWAQVLEPVRKLPTNVGARIRRCVHEALQKNPPEWAKKKLEHSISKEVYKGNASGPTKRAVISVLEEVNRETSQQKPEKKEKQKSTVSDLIMKQCRIVLRRAIAADEDRVFCNLLGKTFLNPSENDEEGILGYPTMVSRPLDFRTIDLRLAAGAYCGSHEAFLEDVREVWQNVRTAFRDQPDVINLAETLSRQFEELYEKEVITVVQKTMVGANNNCSSDECDREGDDILGRINEVSLPKVPWDEGLCKVCGMDKDDDNVLLCDGCDSEFHIYCLNPPLLRIPEGNWYCPSCVSGIPVSQFAAESARAVNRSGRKRKKNFIHKNLEMLAQLANRMESKDYWELTTEERIFLLKFLCDEALSSAVLRDHLDHSASACVDSQQRLRSLNSERKILKFRQENLVMKTKNNVPVVSGELGRDALPSVLTDEVQMSDRNKVCLTPGGSKKIQDGSEIRSQTESVGPFEKTVALSTSENTKKISAFSELFYQRQPRDRSSCNAKATACMNELPPSTRQRGDHQSEEICGKGVDFGQTIGDKVSIPSVSSSGFQVPRHSMAGKNDREVRENSAYCSNQASGISQEAELFNLQNEISGLQHSIGAVESELLRLAIRKEFLGRDSEGRIYWNFGKTGACPSLLANGNLDIEGIFGSNSSTENSASWASYNLVKELKELVKWLNDDDIRERDLKDTLLHWLSQKNVDLNSTERDIFNMEKPHSSLPSNGEMDLDADCLVTKAVKALEKKCGHLLDMQPRDSHKDVKKDKVTYQDKVYRCECLELVWPSRPHCFSCHTSFSNIEELTQHSREKCENVSTVHDGGQVIHDSSKHRKMPRNQPGEKGSGNSNTVQTLLSDKHGNQTNFVEDIHEPESPFNLEEIKKNFKNDTSFKELVKGIGLIGSHGAVSFVPNSLYMNDPALTLIQKKDSEAREGDVPSGSEGQQSLPDNGNMAALAGVNNNTSDYLQSNAGDKAEVAKAKCMKPILLGQGSQRTSAGHPSPMSGVSLSSLIRETSLRPKAGKAIDVLRCLKIGLLDMDAALPEAALRSSRSKIGRSAWRTFVKSAKSLYEMVQATIILEDTIKADYLKNDWWYWSSTSAAANITSVSGLALRINVLDSAILYEKPLVSEDTTEPLGDTPSSDPTTKTSEETILRTSDMDSVENSRPKTRTSKRRRDQG